MPVDTQIPLSAVTTAPSDYVIPGSVELRLKTVRAQFNGASSTAAWLPAVQLISDSGQIIATALDQNWSVAAGGSADATFFPGGMRAPAAASSTTTFARAWGLNFSGQSVNAGTTKNCSFDTVRTSSSAQIQWSTTTVLNDTFKIMTTGWALISASCQWPAGTLVDYRIDSPGGFELFQHDALTKFSGQGSDFTVGLPTHMDSVWIDSTAAAGTQFRVRMTNNDAGPSGPDTAMVAIMFFPGLSL